MRNKIYSWFLALMTGICLCKVCDAQTAQLWGITSGYGYQGSGGIIHLNLDGTGFATPYVCNCEGNGPTGNLIQLSNGLWYGMTPYTGLYGAGLIFSFDAITGTFTDLYNFANNAVSGGQPGGSLIQATNGLLYGITKQGGAANAGVIFSFDPVTRTYNNLYSFGAYPNDGQGPYGSLLQATNGLLYGLTPDGGRHSGGVLFSYNISTSTYTVVSDFGDSLNIGLFPFGSLRQAQNGLLYGMSFSGGAGSEGTIFSYNTATSTCKTVYSFLYALGGYSPAGELVQAPTGLFYGLAGAGGTYNRGGIFSYDLNTSNERLVVSFDTESVFSPFADQSIMQAANGILYGMSYAGSSSGFGSIFSYNPSTSVFNNIYNFRENDSSGAYPLSSLVQGSDGNLYGMTTSGGLGYGGVIFNFNLNDSTYQNLYSFTEGEIPGCGLSGNLTKASNGLLYSTTRGGLSAQGTIFALNPANSVYTKVFDFMGDSGSYPTNRLLQASDGSLYGMTSYGGPKNDGVIFRYNPQTLTYSTLYNFAYNDSSGAKPEGGFIQASDSLLYGMTYQGGVDSDGVIFNYNPLTSTYKNLYSFTSDTNSGSSPTGRLVQANNGLLYGLTQYGGSNNQGVIFSFNPVTLQYVNLYSFTDSANSGSQPTGSLIQASDSLLYGMAGGGAYSKGVIFSFNPVTSVYNNLFNFSGGPACGAQPYYESFIQASNGLLYATTHSGGSENAGTVFSFNPVNQIYTNLLSLPASAADYPMGDLLELGAGDTIIPCTSVYTNTAGTICGGDTFYIGTTAYAQGGTFNDTLLATNGCDSILILHLTVLPVDSTFIIDTICSNYGVLFNGSFLNVSGTYLHALTNVNGCDSLVLLKLTVLPVIADTVNKIICWHQTYYNYDSSGQYIDTFESMNSCDSIRLLKLTVLPLEIAYDTEVICQGQSYQGHAQSGNYIDTVTAINNCEKIDNLNLTVLPVRIYDSVVTIACGDSVIFADHTYKTTGTYTDTVTGSNGCDSVMHIILTVDTITTQITQPSAATLVVTGTGNITWLDCSTHQLVEGATSNTFTANASGSYAAIVTNGNCSDTTGCITVIVNGIGAISNNNMSIYPNPTSNSVNIVLNQKIPYTISLYHIKGNLLAEYNYQDSTATLDLSSYCNGVYFITISTSQWSARQKIVKME